MKRLVRVHNILLAVAVSAVIFSACSNDSGNTSPDPMPTPKFTIAPSVLPIDGTPKGEAVMYIKGNADIAAAEAINLGLVNGFVSETEFIYMAKSMDLNGDGLSDLVIAIGKKSDHDEAMQNYTGADTFIPVRALIGLKEGGYTLLGENSGMMSTEVFTSKNAKAEIRQENSALVISTVSEEKDGKGNLLSSSARSFYCAYSGSEGKLLVNEIILEDFSSSDIVNSSYIIHMAENIVNHDFTGFSLNDAVASGENDGRVVSENLGSYEIRKIYPLISMKDMNSESSFVRLVEQGFSEGAAALAKIGSKKNVTIECKKVFQDDRYISIVYTVKNSMTGILEFRYGMNIEFPSYRALRLSEIKPSNQISVLFEEQERRNQDVYGIKSCYQIFTDDEISKALKNIDMLDEIGGGPALFSKFTNGEPYIFSGVDLSSASIITINGDPAKNGNTVTVNNAEELLAALGSDANICLMPGIYNLAQASKASIVLKEGVSWQDCGDGKELVLDGIKNLTLEGIGSSVAEIVTEPRNANVFTLNNCSGISIYNLKLGHSPQTGTCDGAVLKIVSSDTVTVENSTLYGSGTMGIDAYDVSGLNLNGTIIENCTEAILSLNSVRSSKFMRCTFRNNTGLNMMGIISSSGINFDYCDIKNNSSINKDNSFFMVTDSDRISFSNSSITNNRGYQPQRLLNGVSFNSITAYGNSFSFEYPYMAEDIKRQDLHLGIISVGMSRDELIRTLGTPVRTDKTVGSGDPYAYMEACHFTTIDIGLVNGQVCGIASGSETMATDRGIKPGMSVEDIYNKYGYAENIDGVISYPYIDKDNELAADAEVYFAISGSKVTRIGIRAVQ